MAEQPDIPEGFYQHCIKYEYFKRNSAQQAHQNVCGIIDGRQRSQQFPDVEPEFSYAEPVPQGDDSRSGRKTGTSLGKRSAPEGRSDEHSPVKTAKKEEGETPEAASAERSRHELTAQQEAHPRKNPMEELEDDSRSPQKPGTSSGKRSASGDYPDEHSSSKTAKKEEALGRESKVASEALPAAKLAKDPEVKAEEDSDEYSNEEPEEASPAERSRHEPEEESESDSEEEPEDGSELDSEEDSDEELEDESDEETDDGMDVNPEDGFEDEPEVGDDVDSDDDGIEDPIEDVESEGNAKNDQCTLTKAKWLYEKLAKKEIGEYLENGWENILEILNIRRIAKAPLSEKVYRECEFLRILTGYRRINLKIQKNPDVSISYMSTSTKGCLIWYGDTVKIDDRFKYQSLAARDYFYIVKQPESLFLDLIFDIEDYSKWNPAIWPFSNVFWKIGKYLRRIEQICVEKLFMKMFYKNGQSIFGLMMLRTVWDCLRPESPPGPLRVIRVVKLRVWIADELCKRRGGDEFDAFDGLPILHHLYGTEQWMQMRILDVTDWRIHVNGRHFVAFSHLHRVRLMLNEQSFGDLVTTVERIPNNTSIRCRVCFVVDEEFQFGTAVLYLQEEYGMESVRTFQDMNGNRCFEAALPNNVSSVKLWKQYKRFYVEVNGFRAPQHPSPGQIRILLERERLERERLEREQLEREQLEMDQQP